MCSTFIKYQMKIYLFVMLYRRKNNNRTVEKNKTTVKINQIGY